MTASTRITIAKSLPYVARVNVWKNKRAYVELAARNGSYRGCSNHQLYIDMETGELVNQMGRGATPREYDAQVAQFVAAMA